ncbi:hypothetical protein [Hydrogenimonas sp.]
MTTRLRFRCPKCAEERVERVGDVIVSLPECPRCGETMEPVAREPEIWEKIDRLMGKVFKRDKEKRC